MKGTYIFLANGFEDMEALSTLDVLLRGGVEALTVAVQTGKSEDDVYGERFVTSAHGLTVVADLTFDEFLAVEDVDDRDFSGAMIFPGGLPGAKNLAETTELMSLMKEHFAGGGLVAAICAAPGLVASQLPGIEGRSFTCYDGFEEYMTSKGAVYVKRPAVADGNLVTGRGPGCAVDFACEALRALRGDAVVASVRAAMMLG